MSTITFGSVGDIISICLLTKEIIGAIDESRGSAKEYRELADELRSLERALLEAALLLERHKSSLRSIADTIIAELNASKTCLEQFSAVLARYNAALRPNSSVGPATKLAKSVQWRLAEKDIVAKFTEDIARRFNALSMLLITANIELSMRLSRDNDDGQRTLSQIQANLTENTGLVKSMNMLLRQVYGKIGMMTTAMFSIRAIAMQTLRHCHESLQTSHATYGAVVTMQQSLSSRLERVSLIEEPFILEDAIGRISPVHLQFVTSWKALDAILQVRFKGTQGYGKVKRKEFVLQERATARNIGRQTPWEVAFRPGQVVDMGILFRECIQVASINHSISSLPIGHKDSNCCPRCQTAPEEGALDIRCNGCGMIYRRVRDLSTPVTGIGAFSSKENPLSQISSSTKQAENSLGRKKLKRNLNDIKRYHGILVNFKRIIVLSRHELIHEPVMSPRPMVDSNRQSPAREEDADLAEQFYSDGSLFCSLTPSCFTRRCPHPAAEWKYYFCEMETHELEDFKHAMLTMLCGDIIIAPVKKMLGSRSLIIDMGTGNGSWPIDVADMFPNVHLWGIDYKPLQSNFVPLNLDFILDDVDSDWLLDEVLPEGKTVDYIHAREMIFAVKDWRSFMNQSFKCLRPGGWVEVQYIDYHPLYQDTAVNAEDNPFSQFWSHINHGLRTFGIDDTLSDQGRMVQVVEDAGFQAVKEISWRLPIGSWPKDKATKKVGLFMKYILDQAAVDIAKEPLVGGLGWSDLSMLLEVSTFRMALKTCPGQPYFMFRSVYGQKPG